MKIVIIGDGKVGSTLVEQLSKEGHDIVVIDNKGEVLEAVGNMHDVMCVEGDGISYKIQREAGVDECDLLIAATSRDEVNMLCCMIAKKVGGKAYDCSCQKSGICGSNDLHERRAWSEYDD